MKVQLCSNGVNCTDTFEVNDIGFSPAPKSEFYLAKAGSTDEAYAPLSEVTKIKVNGSILTENNAISKNYYFTENDIIASQLNKYVNPLGSDDNPLFDIICNNGTKRIAKADGILCYFKNGESSSLNQSIPFYIRTQMPTGDTEVKTKYFYDDIVYYMELRNVAERTSNKITVTSTSTVRMDFSGKIIKEVDEYGVRTEYEYDDYGMLIQKKLFDTNGKEVSAINYTYDSNGRSKSANDSFSKNNLLYDSYGNMREEFNSVGSDYGLNTQSTLQYDIFRERPLQISTYDDDNNRLFNKITYQDGRIRTVTDGTVKYGVKYNLTKDNVEYTVFSGDKEKVVQMDQIERNTASGQETHTSCFYNEHGDVAETSSVTIDKYGRTTQTRRQSDCFTTSYNSPSESKLTSHPVSFIDPVKGTKISYMYDRDGNLTGWDESNYGGTETNTRLRVQQIADNVTQYYFGSGYEYRQKTNYDTKVIMSPRVINTTLYRNTQGSTEEKYEDYKRIDYSYDSRGRLIGKKRTFEGEQPNENRGMYQNYTYKDIGSSYVVESTKYHNGINSVGGSLAYNVSLEDENSYDSYGRLAQIKRTSYRSSHSSTPKPVTKTISYTYDKFNRITSEKHDKLGFTRSYKYGTDGRLASVTESGKTTKRTYDGFGRLEKLGTNTTFTYDHYGNRTSRKDASGATDYGYSCGNLVKVGDDIGYTYDGSGRRSAKYWKTYLISQYFYDGGKLLREHRGTNKYLTFMYDQCGLNYFTYADGEYEYVLDSQGNVAMLVNMLNGDLVARYEYDMWGNCTVYDQDGIVNTDMYFIGNINPFRWKSFYFDTDTGLYYANGSNYDPTTGLYLDATPISTAIDNAMTPGCLDRNGLMCNNTHELAGNPFSVATTVDLSPDPSFTPQYSWWTRTMMWYKNLHWGWKVITGAIYLAAALAITFFTAGGGIAGLVNAVDLIIQVAFGVVAGMGIYLFNCLLTVQKPTLQGMATAALDSFIICSFFAFVSATASALKHAARGTNNLQAELHNNCANNCFVAGTLVLCEDGYKNIEDIQVGDRVLAYDEQTGENAYKEVVRLFRNESKDWIELTINGEEILSTQGHKYYLPKTKQWVSAIDLQVGDTVLLSKGNQSTIESKLEKHCDTPQTTYNFEVADFHTYYVGIGVLVHNENCAFGEFYDNPESLWGKTADDIGSALGKGWQKGTYGSQRTGWKFIQNDKMIAYHPGGGYHIGSYYKISSGMGVKKVVGVDYVAGVAEKAIIVRIIGG